MADEANMTPFQIAWLNYVKGVRVLLVPQVDDRPLDQYLSFRDTVLALVQNERFLRDIDNGLVSITEPKDTADIRDALLLELEAFPRAVDVYQNAAQPEERKVWWRSMLSRAGTVSGSVKDIAENLPPYAKQGLTLFKELIDLFKG